jgi:hypothetical protein
VKRTKYKSGADDLRTIGLASLNRIVEPLAKFLIEIGISAQEFNELVRRSLVRGALQVIKANDGHVSISRIAVATGIPRIEVTRLLSEAASTVKGPHRSKHRAQRILDAWFQQPGYQSDSGTPVPLKIYGNRPSLENLVRRHSGGMPIRAVLDELLRVGVVRLLPHQRIKVTSRAPTARGLTGNSLREFGDRTRDLLNTLAANTSETSGARLLATATADKIDGRLIPQIRRDLTEQGQAFWQTARGILESPSLGRVGTSDNEVNHVRAGITVFYFEDTSDSSKLSPSLQKARKNFSRKRTQVAKVSVARRLKNGSKKK